MSIFGSAGQNSTANPPSLNINTSSAAPSANPLFGNKAPADIFGANAAKPASTNIFGGSNIFASAAGNTNTSGMGLFGQSQQAANVAGPSTTPANPFMNPTANTQGSTLFGQNTATQPLFGQTQANQPNSTGLFGQSVPAQPSTGLFGQMTTPAQPTNAGTGLFGATQPAAGGSLFGGQQPQQTTSSLFGNASQLIQPKPAGTLFGGLGQSNNAGTNSSFTFPSSGGLGASTLGVSALGGSSLNRPVQSQGPAASAAADAAAQSQQLQKRIEGIVAAWNSASPDCRFHHFFYNLVDPAVVHQYGRPANATNDASWARALRENPDSTCLVPTLAVGFDDVRSRVQAQSEISTAHQDKIKDLSTRIKALSSHHSLSHSPRLLRAAAQHVQITQRLLRLIKHLHLLIPSVRSSAIKPEEETLRALLEEMMEELKGGAGVKGRVNELWARVGSVAAARERSGMEKSGEWRVVDEEGLMQIAKILSDQQSGLQHLTKILQGNLRDLAVIEGKTLEQGETDVDSAFQASTSALRSTTIR